MRKRTVLIGLVLIAAAGGGLYYLSLIHISMTKNVTDCAAVLETIASYDKKDSTSMKREEYDFTSALVRDVKGLRIGLPKDYFGDGLDSEVKAAIFKAAETFKPVSYTHLDVYKRQVYGRRFFSCALLASCPKFSSIHFIYDYYECTNSNS